MKYETVAEAYRDLEQASGRLALVERLAALLAATPAELLPVVCYLCQGLIAPEFAGVDLGLAEKLAIRAVATAVGASPAEVTALVRQTGDLGLAAERLLTVEAADRPASLTVTAVVDALHQIAAAEGTGSQGRKLDLLAGLLARATPLEARYLLRLVTKGLRLGIGTPTILDALAQVYAGGRAARPVLERAYNICCDLGRVAAALAAGGLAAVEQIHVRPGNPVRAMLAQRLSEAAEILAKLGGQCAAEYKYDGVRVQAHRTADGAIELFTRRLERVSAQFPDVVASLAAGLGPREAILEGEVVAYDAAAGELHPFGEVMFRRRKHGIDQAVLDVPVGLFCFELLYADGQDLTQLPYPQRRAALSKAITVSDRLRLTTATEIDTPAALDAAFEQAVTDGCEGLVCKAVGPDAIYQAGARGWLWIKLKRDYRTELSDTVRSGRCRRIRRPRPPRRGVRRAAAGRLRPRRRPVPHRLQVRHRVHRRRPGRAARTARAAGRPGQARPGRCPPATRHLVRARTRPGDPVRRAHPVPELLRRLGSDQVRRRPGHALPPVHRTMARRQGPRRRHHHAGAGRSVPHRPADTGKLNTLSWRSRAGHRGPGAVPRRPRTPPGPPAGARIGAAGAAAARRRRPGTYRPSASAS